MLVLKGNAGKSEIINSIMKDNGFICYAYYDMPVIYGDNAFIVDSNEYSLKEFFDGIYSEFVDVLHDEYYRYLIIYTNNKENELKQYIDWIKENRKVFRCGQILITCTE